MKKVIKKGLSCLIAGLMAFSGISGALAANEGGASDAGDENVIDLSHENPAGSGSTFGVETDAVWRYQTFDATKDGVIGSVEVYVVKRNPDIGKPGDLKAAIYPMDGSQPADEALQTVTVPEAQVNDKAPTSIDFDVQVEAGKRYALALTADPAGQQDPPITKPTYDWVKKDLGLDLPSGKIRPEGNWVDESFLGTYWCKLYYGISNTIDLSHENPAGSGSTFGVETDAVWRYQTFDATKDGVIGSVEVYVVKRSPTSGDAKPGNLVAAIYPITDGVAGEALQTVTVPEAQVNDKAPTSIDFNVQVEAGKRYALALTTDPLGQQDAPVTQPTYDWVNKDIGLNDTLPSGKINPSGAWVDETKYINTLWCKMHYVSESENVPPVDFTFDTSDTTWGYGVGAGEGEAARYQTFTAPASAKMTSAEVFLLPKGRAAPPFANLIAKLYDTNEDGTPKTELASVTKPYTEIPGNGVYKLDLAYQLEAGKRYAVVLTTDKLAADNSGNNGDHYNWPTSNPAQPGEFFGAITPAGVASDQTNLGTAYLKVNFNEKSDPAEPVPTKVELTADKTILKQGEAAQLSAIVLDQFGVVMADQTVTYESDKPAAAAVDPTGKVTAVGEGVAAITATCGVDGPSSKIYITVADDSGMLEPVPGMIITEDVKFKPGEYDFGGSEQGITIKSDNITVDGTGVRIYNAKDADILADVTTGAYAYQLNPVDRETSYCLTREFDFSSAEAVKFSFDSKVDGAFAGALKVYASVGDGAWNELKTVAPTNDWSKAEVDLSAYAGQAAVKVRVAYENSASSADDMKAMGLKLDTFEIFEDGVRTFSDLCSSKVFYWWKVSYGDEAPIETPATRNKPFDRTSYDVDTSLFKGTALTVEDSSKVTIKGFDVSGFYYALEAYNSNGLTIENNNFSDNYTNPNGGWGDQLGGAVLMENVNGSTIRNNVATNNANGLYLRFSDNNVITDNNFSDCSDVCLELWNSSKNRIEDNDFSWGIRIDPYDEVHARDSTSSLIEAASNYNYVKNNDFTHGGDGIFVRALNGMCSEYNVFEGNDTSFANNNAVECGMGRNYWYNNKANWSSFGFWMGGSDENVMIGNEMGWNGIMPANAPTGQYGNSGISMTGWSSEHEIIVDNYIHDNAGAGIGMMYRENQPSFNGLIQNNRIVNNGQYAIYLENADWFEINGNVMEGNGTRLAEGTDGDVVHQAANVTNIIQRDGAQYQENYENYLDLVPEAVIESAPANRFSVGEEVAFTAENSTDPNGKPLTFRWEMGDGTVLAGETVRYTFKEPGFYDVAVSATNGDWTDIAWISVNVVAGGEEIGTESLEGWSVTENGGKTALSLQEPDEEIPTVGGVSMEHPIYYVIDGNKSVKMTSTAQNNTLTYPQTMDAGFDFSNEYAFGFSMKLHNQNQRNGANSPVVTLYTDENNYVSYTPSDPLMFPHAYETFTEMQYRHEWYPVNIPLEGGNGWVAQTAGTPDFSEINYITIDTQSGGSQTLEMWIDGMKTISKDALPAYGANIAADGKEAVSSSAAGSQTGINQQVNLDNKWVSNVEKESFYGVTFSGLRNIDQVSFYSYYQPTGLADDVIGLPYSYEVQYLKDGDWTPVANQSASSSVAPNENIVKFDMVRTDGIRVVLKNADGMASALYGFQAINSNNYAAEKKADGSPAVDVKTSINSDITVNAVDMYLCVAKEDTFPEHYSDFLVFIYETSADGRTPVGDPIGKGVLPVEEIEEGGLNKPYNIKMTNMEGGDLVLKAGSTYVLGATQDIRLYPNNECYRWPTSQHPDGVDQFYGKYEPQSDGTFANAGTENLGTGWMRVYTDRDADGKPLIDYSYELSGSSGYGVGCESGEVGRYQTFTFPTDPNGYTIDGKVESEEGWATRGGGETDYLTYTFEDSKEIGNALVFLDGVPEKVTIKAGEQVLAEKTKDQLKNGENAFTFTKTDTGSITVEIVNSAESVTVREVELMGADIPDETVVDKSALKEQIDKADSLKEADYTADSWENMQNFLAKAKDVYNDPKADQAAVNGAAKDLEQAISDLEDVIVPGEVDKTELNRAIKQAESLKKELYTADSWDKMQEKLKAARDVYANPDADQPAVNLAAEELSEAIANLDLVNPPAEVDKSGLKDAVNRAETLNQEGYTDSSWRWFQSALEEAKAVLADSDATQAMVDSAEARLEAAMEDLEKTEAGSGGHTATGDWLVSGISILLAALALAGAGIVIFRRRKRDA